MVLNKRIVSGYEDAKSAKSDFPGWWPWHKIFARHKALPKEMLPIVDKPLIQYAVEEAADAGIEEFIFVTGRKSAIEDHFDHSFELESTLITKNKNQALGTVRQMMRNPDQWYMYASKNRLDGTCGLVCLQLHQSLLRSACR